MTLVRLDRMHIIGRMLYQCAATTEIKPGMQSLFCGSGTCSHLHLFLKVMNGTDQR